MSLYNYIMQCKNTFKYIFTNLFVRVTNLTIPREASSTLTDLYSETLPANCIPDFCSYLKCVHFVDRLCRDSRQTVCTSQPTIGFIGILFGYRFACFWIQNTVQCFLFPNRLAIVNTRHKDFSRLCSCGRLWPKTTHFLEIFNSIRK